MKKLSRQNTDSIDETPARDLAASLLDAFIQPLCNIGDGDAWFEAEDELTELINNWFIEREKTENNDI